MRGDVADWKMASGRHHSFFGRSAQSATQYYALAVPLGVFCNMRGRQMKYHGRGRCEQATAFFEVVAIAPMFPRCTEAST